MNTTLLDQFLVEECTPYVRSLLQEAMKGASSSSSHFEFNRFEITIERGGEVLIEDVLDATDAGAQRVPLEEFTSALERASAK